MPIIDENMIIKLADNKFGYTGKYKSVEELASKPVTGPFERHIGKVVIKIPHRGEMSAEGYNTLIDEKISEANKAEKVYDEKRKKRLPHYLNGVSSNCISFEPYEGDGIKNETAIFRSTKYLQITQTFTPVSQIVNKRKKELDSAIDEFNEHIKKIDEIISFLGSHGVALVDNKVLQHETSGDEQSSKDEFHLSGDINEVLQKLEKIRIEFEQYFIPKQFSTAILSPNHTKQYEHRPKNSGVSLLMDSEPLEQLFITPDDMAPLSEIFNKTIELPSVKQVIIPSFIADAILLRRAVSYDEKDIPHLNKIGDSLENHSPLPSENATNGNNLIEERMRAFAQFIKKGIRRHMGKDGKVVYLSDPNVPESEINPKIVIWETPESSKIQETQLINDVSTANSRSAMSGYGRDVIEAIRKNLPDAPDTYVISNRRDYIDDVATGNKCNLAALLAAEMNARANTHIGTIADGNEDFQLGLSAQNSFDQTASILNILNETLGRVSHKEHYIFDSVHTKKTAEKTWRTPVDTAQKGPNEDGHSGISGIISKGVAATSIVKAPKFIRNTNAVNSQVETTGIS